MKNKANTTSKNSLLDVKETRSSKSNFDTNAERKKIRNLNDHLGDKIRQQAENEELIKRIPIKDSPFTVITTEQGSFGSMGKWRLTELGEEKQIIKEMEQITWNRIIQIIALITDSLKT